MKNSSPREGLDIKNIVSSSGGNLGVPCSCVPLLYSLQERSLPVSFWPVKVDVLDARWSNLLEIIVGELQGRGRRVRGTVDWGLLRSGGGVLPYITYTSMCRPTGS